MNSITAITIIVILLIFSCQVTLDTRLRDICTAKRREMEVMLNGKRDQRDWKALARDLGNTLDMLTYIV